MGQKDHQLAKMSALDEALRRMVRTCPVPREMRSVAEWLAARPPPERPDIPHGDSR
jgi:hypothetical protein